MASSARFDPRSEHGWQNRWRVAAWSAAALLLLLPLGAMQFTDEVTWTALDFAVFGALLLGVGLALEGAVRKTGDRAYRAAVAVALAGAFLLVWANGAVGIIGDATHPANELYAGVLAAGVVGGLLARFRPQGMARTLGAMALAQAGITGIALFAWSLPGNGPLEILVANGVFVALWLVSARLFRASAQHDTGAATA